MEAAQVFLVPYLGAVDEVGQGYLEVLCETLPYVVMLVRQDSDSEMQHGCGGRVEGVVLRTIGARALYRPTLRNDLPEYMLLVGIPLYLDLRDKV